MRLLLTVLLSVGAAAFAADPCNVNKLRDTAPLAAAAAQDKVLAASLQKTATVCGERGDACDQARLECSGLLASIIQKQVSFDEGMWLRDLLLPYLGQQYAPTRQFGAFTLAQDASCNVDVATLTAAAQRRRDQAARREVLFQEYALFAKWADGVQQGCRDRAAADQQKAAAAKAESEKLAATVTATAAVEAAKKKAEEDARKKAEEDARRYRENQEQAMKLAAEQQRQREASELRAQQERVELEQRARQAQIDAETRGRQAQIDAEERMRQAREAEKKAEAERVRVAEEQRLVVEREKKTADLRGQKQRLVADAEAAYERALAEEGTKKKAAVDAVKESPAVAQAAVAQAAEAEHARIAAEKQLGEARLKAERIEIDDSFERSRGHLAALGGGGAFSWFTESDTASSSLSAAGAGAMISAHLGFWGQAPLKGIADGFEVALAVRFFQAFSSGLAPREFEGHATARYYFGPLGLGAAGEFRSFDSAFGVRPFGMGPSIGIAVVDTPSTRVIFSANWLPVGTAIDFTRFTGEFEVSYRWFTFRLLGGSFNQVLTSTHLGWQIAGFAGVRLSW